MIIHLFIVPITSHYTNSRCILNPNLLVNNKDELLRSVARRAREKHESERERERVVSRVTQRRVIAESSRESSARAVDTLLGQTLTPSGDAYSSRYLNAD